MAAVTNSIFIRGEPRAIFDFVTTAKYWTQWHPATIGVGGQIEKPMRLGDVIRERARIGQAIGENDWTVTAWEQNERVVLAMPGTRLGDLQITYTFAERDGGMEFTRELIFDAGGFPREIADALALQMDSDSRIATERIKEMFEESRGN